MRQKSITSQITQLLASDVFIFVFIYL